MSDTSTESIHREFELERMILFSDAVFAIAITLLIIEIKFPEIPANYKGSPGILTIFKPTLKDFMAFLLSFFFIGLSWARHLKMFRYLKSYDNGVIFRNLLSLLFIVTFPFVASGITHARPTFMFPILIYLGNILLMALSNFWLTYYIFRQKPSLSFSGHEAEKKYIYMQSMAFALILSIAFTIVGITAIASNFDNEYILRSFFAVPLVTVAIRIWLRKFKPPRTVVARN